MLTVKDLEEFENYMRSGELETDFKDGCENDRYYLLELLEKFMDVAELADETATRVIFRGQIGLLAARRRRGEVAGEHLSRCSPPLRARRGEIAVF